MTRKGWIVLGILLAALVAVQRHGLDPRPEKRLEDRYTKVAEMPAGDMVPTYVASLFFGAFRAVVIDVLWIQLKRVEDERRWYERREILKLISYFQPRNPEVWSHLGWHSAYNVANGFRDPEKAWEWTKFGLTWLRQGNRMLPDSPHLKYELGYTLLHKPSWRDGRLDLPLLAWIEEDAELQAELADAPAARPRSAFELAIPWFERARKDLERIDQGSSKTQMGLYLYQSTMDGFILQCLYKQGIYLWRHRGRPDEAREWFLRAARHAREMSERIYPEGSPSPLFADRAAFYARMPELMDLEARAREGRREEARAFVAAAQEILGRNEGIDEGYLWSRFDPDSPLNAAKRTLAGPRDPNECNDTFMMSTYVAPGRAVDASLDPGGLDTDFYVFQRPAPPSQGHPEEEAPPSRIPVSLAFTRPEGARPGLRATVFDGNRVPIASAEIEREGELRFESRHYGDYFLKVEALAPLSPWPEDTRYGFRLKVGP